VTPDEQDELLEQALTERGPVDAGIDWTPFVELPDDVGITEGPERRAPFAQDPRVDPRLPRGWTVGQGPRAHTARHGAPAEVEIDSGDAATFAATPGDVFVRPADSSEALEWREPVRRRASFDTPGRFTGGVVFELVRVDLPDWRLAVVERVATYLSVVSIPADEEPVVTFTTDGCGCYDPFPDLVHPGTQQVLDVRWSLLGLSISDPSFDNLPAHCLPNTGVQLQAHWPDLRYGWGQRYTTGMQLQVPSGVTSVRLFATVQSEGAWRVKVGGRLGVWWIGGGPRAAALQAAIKRT
jgi:hypothetical protein